MYQKIAMVCNNSGLHARPAATFIAEAKKFESTITIGRIGDTNVINAKSMVKLLTLGICKGQEVQISAEGVDEVAAVDALVALIQSGFGE